MTQRDDEAMLARLATSLFMALPGAGEGSPYPDAPPATGMGASAPMPTATPPAFSTAPDNEALSGVLPPYAHLPNADMPVHLAPPPVAGFGRTVPPSESGGLDLAALSFAPGVDGFDGGGGNDPIGLIPPSAPLSPGGKGIGAVPAEPSGQLYFLTDFARPPAQAGAPQPANPFGTPVPIGSSPPSAAPSGGLVDLARLRADFPILSERVGGKPLIWLDNGATTQKPRAVIDRLSYFYEHENSNIHRAAHELAARSTDAYEGARATVACFLGAPSPDNIVFTRGTTESINLVAQSWGRANLGPGDAIILSQLEHHANIVPWVRLAQENGFAIRVAPVDDRGDIILEDYARLLDGSVKLVSFTQVSNALGSVTPAKLMTELAHAAGALVLIDGAQSVSHMPVDVRALNPDFFVFSGHKIYGPTGIGVLYGRKEVLDAMPPWQGGGNMIEDVTFEHIRYHGAPMKFEAGTGNIADAVGLGAALDYVLGVGREAICAHEHMLIRYTEHQLGRLPGVRIIGDPMERAGVVSFVMDRHSVPEVGQALSRAGIAVRAGHHCAQPILRRMGVEATVRPSFGLYNSMEDVDAFIRVLHKL